MMDDKTLIRELKRISVDRNRCFGCGERGKRCQTAETATRASGSGRQMPRSAVDAGRCRAPQQDSASPMN